MPGTVHHLLLHIVCGTIGVVVAAVLITVVCAVRARPARPRKRRGA